MSAGSDSARIAATERVLRHKFNDPDVILRALTHPSYTDESAMTTDYERLEFLGDAVLALVIVEEVFHRFPEMSEGSMTKVKITAVSGTTLTLVAEQLGLGELLIVGASEKGVGGRGLASALENVLEALIGALYLDGGLEVARGFILRVLGDRIQHEAVRDIEHPKSSLQEIVQARGANLSYEITGQSGPPHARSFTAQVRVDGTTVGEGVGRSKKEAEMNAAKAALGQLGAE